MEARVVGLRLWRRALVGSLAWGGAGVVACPAKALRLFRLLRLELALGGDLF